MILLPQFRRLVIILTILGSLLVIAGVESWTWKHLNDLRQHADAGSSERFRRAEYLQTAMLRVNAALFRWIDRPDPALATSLRKEFRDLRVWVEGQLRTTEDTQERERFSRLSSRIQAYEAQVIQLLDSESRSLAAWLEQNATLQAEILALGLELARADRVAHAGYLQDTRTQVSVLHRWGMVATFVLIASGAVLTFAIYQGIIAPLQRSLQTSRAQIERQEKLASLGQLAAGVAHEIRNPLTSIKVRLFTQKRALPKSSEAFQDNEFITGEISRLEQIVKEFLIFARPGDPQMILMQATVPLREVVALTMPEFEKSGIRLKEEYLADPQIRIDPQQMKQVLLNLVRNAAEAIGQDGTITLRARTGMKRQRGRMEPVVMLEVEDTGKGIPPDVQKRLFDPFFTTKPSGTGLGLSISARLVEKQGGRLEFQTRLNQGTTFSIVLPMERAT